MESRSEQHILSLYSRLPQEGKEELVRLAAVLLEKYHNDGHIATADTNKCDLKPKEDRPEANPEPVFTE